MMSLKSLTPIFLSWGFLSSVDGFGLLLKRVIPYVAMMGGKGWDGIGWDGAKEETAKGEKVGVRRRSGAETVTRKGREGNEEGRKGEWKPEMGKGREEGGDDC